jgi:hypothetical protein
MKNFLHITKTCVARTRGLDFNRCIGKATNDESTMNEWIPKRSIGAIPLNGLRTFEVVSRHMSLKKAASELNVTPSAVSHRLRVLERILGCKLIRRQGAEMQLTQNGRVLAPALSHGFEIIIDAVGNLQPE